MKQAMEIQKNVSKTGRTTYWTFDSKTESKAQIKKTDAEILVANGEAKYVDFLTETKRANRAPYIFVMSYKSDKEGLVYKELGSHNDLAYITDCLARMVKGNDCCTGAYIEDNHYSSLLIIIDENGNITNSRAESTTVEEVKEEMSNTLAMYFATITTMTTEEAQEVAIQAEITNANNASEKASKAPFSNKEAALLDKMEKAVADNILLLHGNHEAAHQATSIEKRRKRNLESWQCKLIKVATINTSSSCLTKCRQESNAVPSSAVKMKVLPVNMLEVS